MSLQFDNARAGRDGGWVYRSSSPVEASLILPATYEGAGGAGFEQPVVADAGMIDPNPVRVSGEQIRRGAALPLEISAIMKPVGETLELRLGGSSRIAERDRWILSEEEWLYSGLSLQHKLTAAVVPDGYELDPDISLQLSCGGEDGLSFIRRDLFSGCRAQFSDNAALWGYYVEGRRASSASVLIAAQSVGDDFELGAEAAASAPVPEGGGSFGALPAKRPDVELEIANVVVRGSGVQRQFSFPITEAASPAVMDRDQDGVPDDGTLGDEAEYVSRDAGGSEAFLSVTAGAHIGLGPDAYSAGFAYDSGAGIDAARSTNPAVMAALSSTPSPGESFVPGIGVFDFYLRSDHAFDGRPVHVSIPLKQGLPEDAGYWIYGGRQWSRHEGVYSAPEPCPPIPAPGGMDEDSGWSAGLTEGHRCLLVELADDCSADGGPPGIGDTNPGCGIIADIAALTAPTPATILSCPECIAPRLATSPSAVRLSGGGSADGWLLSGLLAGLLVSSARFAVRRRKRAA